jgi:hypothetical protein
MEPETTSRTDLKPAPPSVTAEPPADGQGRLAGARRLWHRLRADARANPILALAIVTGLVARIAFWAITDRRLDDALITIKFDKNLAAGFGLVHNLGDGHVHGFTSALSVLVPLPGELIYDGGGFLLIRLVSLGAFVLAAIYGYRICRQLKIGSWPTGLALAYLALDQNQVMFAVAGMETQIAVAILLAGIYYVLVEDYVKSGVALGLALLARPDFVLWIVPAYAFLFLHDWRRALRAGGISDAVIAPWIIFTAIYYGSPVANTIAAKDVAFGPVLPPVTHPGAWIDFLANQFSANAHYWTILAPFYEAAFLTHAPIAYGLAKAVAFTLAGLAILGAIATWGRSSWRPAIALLLLLFLDKVVFLTVGYFEWYGPPAMAVMVLMAAAGLDRVGLLVARAARHRIAPAAVVAVPAVFLVLLYALPLPYRAIDEARVQHRIEDKVRQPLGEYLGRVVNPGESLTSESSGYVGYWTNGTLYDYPGLVSTTVVDTFRDAAPKTDPRTTVVSLLGIIHLLRPDWLVLRPWEAQALVGTYPEDARQYREMRRFSVPESQSSLKVGGFDLFNIDREFIVFRRVAQPPAPASPPR